MQIKTTVICMCILTPLNMKWAIHDRQNGSFYSNISNRCGVLVPLVLENWCLINELNKSLCNISAYFKTHPITTAQTWSTGVCKGHVQGRVRWGRWCGRWRQLGEISRENGGEKRSKVHAGGGQCEGVILSRPVCSSGLLICMWRRWSSCRKPGIVIFNHILCTTRRHVSRWA